MRSTGIQSRCLTSGRDWRNDEERPPLSPEPAAATDPSLAAGKVWGEQFGEVGEMTEETQPRMIRLRAYDDEIIERVIVEQDSHHVYVCRLEEWEAARHEGRAPMMVGFRYEDVESWGEGQ